MSGGKGGSSTNEVTIPEYIEAAAQRNLNKAERISQIGYTPYYGPDVAAFTPMQQAAFQNTADTAGAFGMAAPTSQQDIMGGMPAPTTYAGGVQGYSSAPMFEQSLDELGRQRPGQKSYIDSFFIDPFTGGGANGNFAPIDYTQYGTMADQAASNRQNDLNIAAMQRAPSSNMTEAEIMQLGDVIAPGSGYNPMTDTLSAEQQAYVNDPANIAAKLAQEDINSSILGNANNNIMDNVKSGLGFEPTFDDPSSAGSYGGSLVTGGLSGDLTPIPGIYGNVADKVLSSVAPNLAISQQGKDFAAAGGSTYEPNMTITNPISGNVSTGGYDFDPNAFSSDYGGGSTTPAPTTPGGSFFGYDGIGDMFDGGGKLSSGDTYQNVFTKPSTSNNSSNNSYTPSSAPAPQPYSAAANTAAVAKNKAKSSNNDSGSGNKSSGGTVMCTAYCNMGYLPREIYKLDRRYGVSLYRNDPSLILGYRKWATPIAEFIKTDTLAAKATRAVMWPIVKAWAEQMAHEMKPQKYSRNIAGKAIMLVGVPFSRLVGAIFVDKSVSKEAF